MTAQRPLAVAAALLALATLFPAQGGGGALVSVIVRGAAGAESAAARAVENLGGRVGLRIGLINGFAAMVPAAAIERIRSLTFVHSVTPNSRVHLMHSVDGFDAATDAGSLYNTTKAIKAQDLWRAGYTGRGIDVALIDSGTVPVNGLSASGKVLNGPDLSFDYPAENLRSLDTYGHGTHMAGIIAGREDGATSVGDFTTHDKFVGVAPDARIVSVKVANAVGATDVSQVIAAIDWVVQHRTDGGLNIRVLNLSFGTDGVQSYTVDPLAYAAEVAWRRGIVVVVAAGNSGFGSAKLNNPAYDPYVIAVGADDTKGTGSVDDDTIPSWSSRGDGTRNPDVVAPGKSIASLRDIGSYIDDTFPEGRVNARFFRGSGTSQATAVTSGAAALLLQQRPSLTPDQVKKLLTSTASELPAADPVAQGSGLINLKAASAAPAPSYEQAWTLSTGTGSLEQARGSAHVEMDGQRLEGETDAWGRAWNGGTWSADAWNGGTWSGGTWSGGTWSGGTWSGGTWSGGTWSGGTWSGGTWSGGTWSGGTWSGGTWSGGTWSGGTWSGGTWSGGTWSGGTWSGGTWSASLWGD